MRLMLSFVIIVSTSLALVTCNPPLTRNDEFRPIVEIKTPDAEYELYQGIHDWIMGLAEEYDLGNPQESLSENIDWKNVDNADDFEENRNEPLEKEFPVDVSLVDDEGSQVLADWTGDGMAEDGEQHLSTPSEHTLRRTRRALSGSRQRSQRKQQRSQRKQQRSQRKQQRSRRKQQRRQRDQRRYQRQQRRNRRNQRRG